MVTCRNAKLSGLLVEVEAFTINIKVLRSILMTIEIATTLSKGIQYAKRVFASCSCPHLWVQMLLCAQRSFVHLWFIRTWIKVKVKVVILISNTALYMKCLHLVWICCDTAGGVDLLDCPTFLGNKCVNQVLWWHCQGNSCWSTSHWNCGDSGLDKEVIHSRIIVRVSWAGRELNSFLHASCMFLCSAYKPIHYGTI